MRNHHIGSFSVACAVLISLSLSVTPAQASRKTNKIVIVGDSVANVLRWAPNSMKPLWKSRYNVILETWGCQQLLNEGCNEQTKLSSFDRIVLHRKDKIDVYVVATGYNDTGPAYLAKAVAQISAEVKKQGASLIWLTYQENANVKAKSRTFNAVIRAKQVKNHMQILDWNRISRNKKKWFSGTSVHMNETGGVNFARSIKSALDIHFGYGTTTSTSTTTTTTTSTTTIPVAE
jgi:hypothetical protein